MDPIGSIGPHNTWINRDGTRVQGPPQPPSRRASANDVTALPPRLVASIPIFADPKERPNPGWVSFGIDGRYAYPDGGAVIDTETKKVVARIPTSEKLIEIDFRNGRPVQVGQR